MAGLTFDPKLRQFIWSGTYQERLLPKKAKFRWDPNRKTWWTNQIDVAGRLIKYAEPETAAKLQVALANQQAALDASSATNANIDIPAPEGFDYLPYQRAGIAYASARHNTMIGDEMGLGKTIQAIGLINFDASLSTVLVICPASLKLNWKRELQRWLTRPLTIGVAGVKGEKTDTQVLIINYDILKKWNRQLRARTWDLLIADECHYLKNGRAGRTKEVLGYWDKEKEEKIPGIPASKRLFLTGTPIVNRPLEMWPLAHALDPKCFRSFAYYTSRYCAAHFNGYADDFSGASNLEELQKKLRTSFLVRRLKKDVLTELPAKVRQVIELPPEGKTLAIKADQRAWAAHEKKIAQFMKSFDGSTNEEDYKKAVKELREGFGIAFNEMSAVRHETALAKVPAVIDYIKCTLESVDKLVVFAHHRDVISKIEKAFIGKSVVVTGATSVTARQNAVDRFQTDESVKLFIGNIKAAGVGLTLTAASHVIFAELDWSPGNLTQAEDRCHRIGQTDSVLVQHLVLNGTLDARMAHMLVDKQRVLDAMLDNEIPADEIDLSDVEKKVADEKKKAEIKKKKASNITEEQIRAVQASLRRLAAICDGALEEDGQGFNKLDAQFGHKLAALESITPGQAVAARGMLFKYRGQLGAEAMVLMGSIINPKQEG